MPRPPTAGSNDRSRGRCLVPIIKKLKYKLWRHSHTPEEYARRIGVNAGEDFHIYGEVVWSTEPWLITVGDNVHITDGVRFETHDGGTLLFRRDVPDLEVTRPIVLGSNVYIGNCAIVMGGGNHRGQRRYRCWLDSHEGYPRRLGRGRRAGKGYRDGRRIPGEIEGSLATPRAPRLGGKGPGSQETLRLHGQLPRYL